MSQYVISLIQSWLKVTGVCFMTLAFLSDILKFISPYIWMKKEFCVSPDSRRINVISPDSLICQQAAPSKALFWIRARLLCSRPYSALYLILQLNLIACPLNCQRQPVPLRLWEEMEKQMRSISVLFRVFPPMAQPCVFLMTDCEMGYTCAFFPPAGWGEGRGQSESYLWGCLQANLLTSELCI